MGSGSARRGTGVSYADVAGIDHVKADIEAMMEAVLGKGGYGDIGMRPPRVRCRLAQHMYGQVEHGREARSHVSTVNSSVTWHIECRNPYGSQPRVCWVKS